jgi:glutathione peroxidase
MAMMIYNFCMQDINGKEVCLDAYKAKVMLIVNVASRCGFTPQYSGLQKLYERYADQGFVILGFPANNFLWQETGTNKDIKQFCSLRYNVTFPMFSKISVKGKKIEPLYRFLTGKETAGDFHGKIKWNFTKFLIDRTGRIVDRFKPYDSPESEKMIKRIEEEIEKR